LLLIERVVLQVSTQPNLFSFSIGSEATGEVVKIGDRLPILKLEISNSIPFNTPKYGVQGEYAVVPDYLSKL
jgi:hypothetical protein